MTRFEQFSPDDVPPIDGFEFEQRNHMLTGEIFDVYRRERVELLLGHYGRQAVIEDLESPLPSLPMYFWDMADMVDREDITPPEDFELYESVDVLGDGQHNAMSAFYIPNNRFMRAIHNGRRGMVSNFLIIGSENKDIAIASSAHSSVSVVLADIEAEHLEELIAHRNLK